MIFLAALGERNKGPGPLFQGLPFFERQEELRGPGYALWWASVDGASPVRDAHTVVLGRPPGRGAVLRFSDGGLDLETDPHGSYPLYRATGGGTTWISNSPVVAGRAAGASGDVSAAAACVLGGGWSLSGDPLVGGVRRIPPETEWHFTADTATPGRDLLRLDELRFGRPLDVPAIAEALVDTLRELHDPERFNVVPLTGGRDSRAVLAAALGQFDFAIQTGGVPGEGDVEVARRLCAAIGREHAFTPAPPDGDRWSRPRDAARILWELTGGTATLADGAGFPVSAWPGPRPLWHTGQGGELARRLVRETSDLDGLTALFLGRRPGRPDLLNDDGVGLVREELRRFLEEASAFRPQDVPDLYYLRLRMGKWAGPTHAAVDPVREQTSAFWSRRVIPLLVAGTPAERRAEAVHRGIVELLEPRLLAEPFSDGTSWTGRSTARTRQLRRVTGKVRRELARRRQQLRPAAPPAADPRQELIDLVRTAARERSDDPVWAVLGPARVDGLLSLPPAALDEWRWFQVWRLATVFLRFDAP